MLFAKYSGIASPSGVREFLARFGDSEEVHIELLLYLFARRCLEKAKKTKSCVVDKCVNSAKAGDAVWGKNDPFFLPQGAEAYKRDNPKAKVVFYDTGHFALETYAAEIGQEILDFLTANL